MLYSRDVDDFLETAFIMKEFTLFLKIFPTFGPKGFTLKKILRIKLILNICNTDIDIDPIYEQACVKATIGMFKTCHL